MNRPVGSKAVELLCNAALRTPTSTQTIVVAFAAFAITLSAQPAGPVLGSANLNIPGVDAGEVLLGELNCAACHSADAAVTTRLASRQSPRLSEGGMRLTPQFLRALLTDPQREKPGTTMPDLFHGMNPAEKAEIVDGLVNYLMSSSRNGAPTLAAADHFKMQQGKLLYHQVGCVACHAPQEPASALRAKATNGESQVDPERSRRREEADSANSRDVRLLTSAATAESVPLSNLAHKTTVDELTKFLLDPRESRPSGRMPSMNLTANEASAIAIYLLREQAPAVSDPPRPLQKLPGLAYQYFEVEVSDTTKFDGLTPKSSGVIEQFSLAPRQRDDNFGFRFNGFVKIPKDGAYTFFTASDDGTKLFIDGKLIVDNDGTHGTTEKKGTVTLTAGDHAIAVNYFNAGGPNELKVLLQAQGIRKREIPVGALSHEGQPMLPLGEEQFAVDEAKAARGKQWFASLGCAACHQVGAAKSAVALNAKPLTALDNSGGCLADKVPKGAADFHLSDAQRAVLRATFNARVKLSQALDPKTQIARTMAALNCYACHSRDGIGGPGPGRADYFSVVSEADLGDEGRLPPHLNQVGDKLRPDWLNDVLLNRGTARPYMATRMPQFGDAAVGPLVAAFVKADSSAKSDTAIEASDAKFGRKLVGAGGLACITCHTFAEYKSLGIPAMDLTLMTKRLKKDWFQRYLLDPSSLRPGTRMPAFWPEGKSTRADILAGSTDRQIDAIWAYLSRAKEVGIPDGLIRGKIELIAEKEAIIYRNFIEGSSRSIGVGYPEKANLSFDANDLRLLMIWQGPFIDAAKHRQDRGEGYVGPLGYNVLKFPKGPSFAVLEDAKSKWPDIAGKKGGFQMRGYSLDEKQRPAFRYSFGQVQIEDYPVAVGDESDAFFLRTLTLRSEQPIDNLWFRAWAGSSIEEKPAGTFIADGKVKFKFSSAGKTVLRQTERQSELLVPVVFKGREAKIVEEIIW